MSQTVHESDEMYLRDLLRELDRSALSMGEIMRERERLPYDISEVRIFRNEIKNCALAGRPVIPRPLDNLQPSLKETMQWIREGLFFLCSPDLRLSLLIVKADAGKGYFGVQKIRYCCYSSSNGYRFCPLGSNVSLTMAFAQITALYRV